jgi:hypothetical protein
MKVHGFQDPMKSSLETFVMLAGSSVSWTCEKLIETTQSAGLKSE